MNIIKPMIRAIPGFQSLRKKLKEIERANSLVRSPFLKTYPPGHFYSPVPDIGEVRSSEEDKFQSNPRNFKGIDIREKEQLELLEVFAQYYKDLPFPEVHAPPTRYYYQNGYYCHSDAIILYNFLRYLKPRRVIEIGSGFSSAVMLDTNGAFLNGETQFTFIEPYPDRLYSLLNENDCQNHKVIVESVQTVDIQNFQELEAGDILFVDSSHVVRFGSDVAHILFNILPELKPGVVIHFHDIFYSFEYPKDWFEMGIAWNEAYFLRVFLQYNSYFQVLYFNSFMGQFHAQTVEDKLPLCLQNTGGSLWIQKIAEF